MPEVSQNINDPKEPRIRIGRVESVDLYQVKDSELDLIEKGSPADFQLNFAIFSLSIALTSITALLTATFTNTITSTIFIVIAVCGFLIGIYLLLSWKRNHTSLKEICKKIRQRIPPDIIISEHQGDINKPQG